jgi:hypothetical protein
MDTRLVNSQFMSRKDVRVWFWDGDREYKGDVVMLAENGIVFHAKLKPAQTQRTLLDVSGVLAAVKKLLEGRKVMVELSSPKTKGEVKLRFEKIETVAKGKDLFAVTATFEKPPDPRFLKQLLETVLQARKK